MFNKKSNKLTGNLGEDVAAEYLKKKNYRILGRNITLDFGEIDILAELRGAIVIIEVKTVRGSGFGVAQDLVRYAKQNKLRLLARAVEQKYPSRTIRIDVIGIDFSGSTPKIEHIESAVEG
jgi:putative endonuclease